MHTFKFTQQQHIHKALFPHRIIVQSQFAEFRLEFKRFWILEGGQTATIHLHLIKIIFQLRCYMSDR